MFLISALLCPSLTDSLGFHFFLFHVAGKSFIPCHVSLVLLCVPESSQSCCFFNHCYLNLWSPLLCCLVLFVDTKSTDTVTPVTSKIAVNSGTLTSVCLLDSIGIRQHLQKHVLVELLPSTAFLISLPAWAFQSALKETFLPWNNLDTVSLWYSPCPSFS